MLGQNLVKLKLSVFMLSAAIAGLGGVLMSSALGTVTSDNFSIFLSLALLMLTVSAGIGYVTGALVGGVTAGVGFTVIISSFNNLSHGSSGLHGLYATLAHVAAILPALVGVTIGRSPSGFLHELFEGYRKLQHRARPVLLGGAAVEALVYVLALTGVIGNWWFGVLTYVILVMLPVFGQMLMPAAMSDAPIEPAPVLESIGIDEPYTDDVRALLDRKLDLPAVARRDKSVREPAPPAVSPRIVAGQGAQA
jgi:hypothetical protein